jgi:hypothetical protein
VPCSQCHHIDLFEVLAFRGHDVFVGDQKHIPGFDLTRVKGGTALALLSIGIYHGYSYR